MPNNMNRNIGLVVLAGVAALALAGGRPGNGGGGGGARVTVSPSSATAGTDVTLTATGFPPNVEASITIGGISRSPIDTDANGGFVRERQIPPELSAGNVQIVVSAGGVTASVGFTVTSGNGGGNGGDPGDPITGITFDNNSHRHTYDSADNWPVTWAANDNQYVSWGDRVRNNARTSLGFARLEGSVSNPKIVDLSTPNSGGKTYGILAIGNTLYSMRTPGSSVTGYKEFALWRSTNGGSSWSTNGPRWTLGEVDAIKPAFLQFGKGYTGLPSNVAGFVYAYVIEATSTGGSDLQGQKPGRVHLMRCPTNDLMDKGSWQWFTGSANNPSWGSRNNSNPVFSDNRGVGWNLSVIYNIPLKRYILCTEHTRSFEGRFQFHDAPAPWGPWHHIDDVKFPDRIFYGNFSQKWMSGDGKSFVFIYTGTGTWDRYNHIQGRFEV